jgi:hypothetical protein
VVVIAAGIVGSGTNATKLKPRTVGYPTVSGKDRYGLFYYGTLPLEKIDLSTLVPPNAKSVILGHKISPATASIKIHLWPEDPAPITLTGDGQTEIALLKKEAVYAEIAPGIEYKINVVGYAV